MWFLESQSSGILILYPIHHLGSPQGELLENEIEVSTVLVSLLTFCAYISVVFP
jgi:hypothetical protein